MKNFLKCFSLILAVVILFSFPLIVKASGGNETIELSPSDLLSYLDTYLTTNKGKTAPKSKCLQFVQNSWEEAYKKYIKEHPNANVCMPYELTNQKLSSSCAYESYIAYRNSNSTSEPIPIGASVYFKGGSYRCKSHIAGHVGIYLGENRIAHAWGGKIQINSFDYFKSQKYTYVGWYCHRGMKLEQLEPTIENSKLKVNLNDFPSKITVGNSYNIKGTVSSNFKITDVRGLIYKDSELLYCIDTCPNSTYVDIVSSKINTNIKFGDLKLGNYTFCIEAFDDTDKMVTIKKSFSIVAPEASTLKINLTSYPTKLTLGSSYGLKGNITSNYKIREVKGQIYKLINNEYKALNISSLDTPNSKYINIASANLNNKIKFGKLPTGRFRISITATDASGKTVTIHRYFTIIHLKINLTSIPSTITQGKGFGLRGDITSGTSYPLKKVSGFITNTNGTVMFSSVDYPNSKTMNIQYSNLNKKLYFGKLKAGSYFLKIKAEDTYGNTDEVSYSFKVK